MTISEALANREKALLFRVIQIFLSRTEVITCGAHGRTACATDQRDAHPLEMQGRSIGQEVLAIHRQFLL